MKIATWNVERLKHKADLDAIVRQCEAVKSDILVLTETDRRIEPAYEHCLRTKGLYRPDSDFYGRYKNMAPVSKSFLEGCRQVRIEEWNHDKGLSDHKGISADIAW